MLILIMLGLLASSLPVVSGWFWGIYVASWILWALKFIIELVLLIYAIRTSNDVDFK